LETPTHWSTIQQVNEETFKLENLSPLSTIVLVVRARNQHGLSPPSPMSKAMMTHVKPGTDLHSDPRVVRLKLAQRIVELQEAIVVGSRKVKLLWEVRDF
jgi:roundabout axon guidance receptor 2